MSNKSETSMTDLEGDRQAAKFPTPERVDYFIQRGRDLRAQALREAINSLFGAPAKVADAAVDKAGAASRKAARKTAA